MYCYGSGPRAGQENARVLRRVLMRRCLLMLVLLFRHISESVHDRFPELDDLVQYGQKPSNDLPKTVINDFSFFNDSNRFDDTNGEGLFR